VAEYEFSLAFALPTDDIDLDAHVERLGACGCDDAVVGIGRKGQIALSFLREADSAEAAILSGITDVRCAIPHATLVEAAPDFVGLSDVAELLHVSRQNMRKLIMDSKVPAPAPVHEGRPTIWRLAKLLRWLQEQKNYSIEDALLAVAAMNMQVNLAVDQKDADSSQSEILAALA
jgi:hypothetical protein